jgi:tetratricopeptide (TPR) repeat protein
VLLLNPSFSGAASLVDGVPLPDNIKVEKPPENLPAEVKQLSGAWEGEWKLLNTFQSTQTGRLKSILVVERLSDRGARILYAWGECPDWKVLKGWGRYEANLSQDAGGVGLSFTTSDGIQRFSINNKGNLESTSFGKPGCMIGIEMSRRPDLAQLQKQPQETRGGNEQAKLPADKTVSNKDRPGSQTVKQGGSRHQQQALAAAKKGNYDEAITEFTRALESDPKDAEAYNNRGSMYTFKRRYDQALADFDKALELHPRYAKAYYNRALAYYYQGNYDRAIADLSKAIELSPKDAEAYNNRGLAYDQKQDYDKAIQDFNVALILNPKLADAYFNKAVSCERSGLKDEAREAYTAFLKLAPPEARDQIEQAKSKIGRR